MAAWAAAYTEERRLELLAGGEDPNLVSAHPLERLCVRLQQFCKERQIPVMETERLGLPGDVAAHTLAAAGFVKEEAAAFEDWRSGKKEGSPPAMNIRIWLSSPRRSGRAW